MRQRFTDIVSARMDIDDRVALVLADIGVAGFARVLDAYPHRAINVGIREQLQVSIAAGLALEGFRPVVHTYAPFLVERAFEQLKLDVTHQGAGLVAVSVGASFDASASGRTHHAPEDVSLMSTLPCWSIVVPGHPDEVEQALAAAFEHSGPVYIRLSELANAQPHDIDHPVDIRRPERGYPTVIAVGPMLDRVLDAVGDDGFGIVYLATLRPFPADPLADLLAGGDVVVAEPYLAGTTLGDLVGAIGDSGARLEAIGVRRAESRRYGAIEDHTAWHGLDPPGLRRRLRETATRWQRAAIA